jgi:hypothetical protein
MSESTKSTAETPGLTHTVYLTGCIISVDVSTRSSTTTFRSDTEDDRLSFVKVTLDSTDSDNDQATNAGTEGEATRYYGFDDNLSKMSIFLNDVSESYLGSAERAHHIEQYNTETPRPGMIVGPLKIAKEEIARRKAPQVQALKEAVSASYKGLLGLPYDGLTIEESPVHADLWKAILARNAARGSGAFELPFCQRAFFAILQNTERQQRADSEMIASVIDGVFDNQSFMALNALE